MFTVSATIIVEGARKDIQFFSMQLDCACLSHLVEYLIAFCSRREFAISVNKVITTEKAYNVKDKLKMLVVELMGVSIA